jgi:hypothetical protein
MSTSTFVPFFALKLKIKNYFGGDSTKGEKINLYMNKGMKQIYDKQMFDIMSNMTCISTIFLLLILFSLRIFLTSFGNFTLSVLFTKLSISVIIFFTVSVLTINRESFDYQGINSVDELKQEWHQYKSLHARAISGFFKGLSKLDNRLLFPIFELEIR